MDEVEVTVMLADISGSTALYDRVGNLEALRQVSACLDQMREIIERHGGTFVSSKGDDVLSIFDSPAMALDVGVEMFQTMPADTLSLHAGIDFGAVIRTRNDVFGDSVNMAARLAGLARSGEILCSQGVHDRLDGSRRSMLRLFGSRQFKGKTILSTIYRFSDAVPGQATEIVFSGPEVDGAVDPVPLPGGEAKAALRFGAQSYLCTTEVGVTMGRSPECDLVVPLPWISRSHATLDVRDGQVWMSDHSSSGTYVCFGARPPVKVQRDRILLPGACILSLARPPGKAGAQEIACDVLEED